MSKSTISVFEFMEQIPDEDSAIDFVVKWRWKGKPQCPHCDSYRVSRKQGKRKGFRCNDCRSDFSAKTGTVFESSNISLRKWLYTIYLFMTARKGISSLQLAKQVGVTQKTSWFMLGRLREACADFGKLEGVIEIDESYFGGAERNKHANKKLHSGRGVATKEAVLGMRTRGGKVRNIHVRSTDKEVLQGIIKQEVKHGSIIMTDSHKSYTGLKEVYDHRVVNHSIGEYVIEDMAHTNSIESVWAVLKRGFVGVYHHFSVKHLQRYVDEFAFRLNYGNVKVFTFDRIGALISNAVGRRLTYSELTL